jgi:predicted metal-dependent peptidase
MRSSRKGWHQDAVMPGMRTTDAIDIAIGIDMSGSISDAQGRDFLAEVQGIMEAFDSYRIHVVCFDTEIYNPRQFDSDNLEDITDYELAGGGGTDFECVFNYLKDNDIEPKKLVMFTDGYPFGSWGDERYCDTVWIIHGNPNPDPPFGVWAKYGDQD